MNPARRATPDSEAVASSEDERPWPMSMKFGNAPMRENSVPGLPGGIWSTQKGRGSFKMSDEKSKAVRQNLSQNRLGPVSSAIRAGNTPSPSASEGAASLPFAIPLQPTPKTGRSLSHSTGQREVPQTSSAHSNAGGHAAPLPLGLLAEEADTESESETGAQLTHTTSHPPMGSLMRTATLPPTFEPSHRNGREYGDNQSPMQSGLLRGKTFESAFANMSLDSPSHRSRWQSSLGWDDLPNVNESRRHSLADIPTRRGSLAAGEHSMLSRTFTHDPLEADEHDTIPQHYPGFAPDRPLDGGDDLANMTRAQETAAVYDIPVMYRVPHVELNATEKRELDARRDQQQAVAPTAQWGPAAGRPRKQLYIVSFKCSRVDVFYLLDNTGLIIREGDLVIVEADRGQDLGTVQHANITPDVARLLRKKYSEEQYKWLMMYSRNKDGGFNPNAQLHGEGGMMSPLFGENTPAMQGSIPRDNFNNLKPKAIKRLANDHEIKMLAEKEGNEAKAKRTCQQKVAHLRLQMEILDAEWQWDFQKLIFYYYADHYINFKDLITELYRIYKTRIWLSAINPASFSQHAMGQPPSGIGPGAVGPYNPYAVNSNYTMAYGEDRDPYGAQMPYRIPYDTYTPNYPSIPGVANSFAPSTFNQGQNFMFYGSNGADPSVTALGQQFQQANLNDLLPSTDPLINRTGSIRDYNFFYDRSGANEHHQLAEKNTIQQQLITPPDSAKVKEHQDMLKKKYGIPAADPIYQNHVHQLGEYYNQQQQQPPLGMWTVAPQYGTANSTESGRPVRQQQPPIGTRPFSQGNHHGVPSEQSRQAVNSDPRQTQFGNIQPQRPFAGDAFSSSANDKANVMDRYFKTLPSPAEMHADEMSRER
ncbi:uncharacterized protein MYCFIDRAFT_196582 [Pseudocercospora fijiensis CIRAD86]|uniref:PSP1 C-terminal domain-containing protein n=1 Tax=Pseudocercospora fijiensis (strain CIRAD86) TaxID=383855 RepID=M2ZW86_PSEFD|nr:uncharacterized protein MYCFIDRAFT_196582 [Pseudocercospora fijiensis CIRAD86]EME83249.1 hypothetical protein MYCFIDRAFT_196582 [Pseudocercospora fijiensis CIRAD86]